MAVARDARKTDYYLNPAWSLLFFFETKVRRNLVQARRQLVVAYEELTAQAGPFLLVTEENGVVSSAGFP